MHHWCGTVSACPAPPLFTQRLWCTRLEEKGALTFLEDSHLPPVLSRLLHASRPSQRSLRWGTAAGPPHITGHLRAARDVVRRTARTVNASMDAYFVCTGALWMLHDEAMGQRRCPHGH